MVTMCDIQPWNRSGSFLTWGLRITQADNDINHMIMQ